MAQDNRQQVPLGERKTLIQEKEDRQYTPRYEDESDVSEEETLEEISEEPEEAETEEPKKFGLIESFLLISFNLMGDVMELLDLTGVGALAGALVDFVNGPATVIYLWLKGTPKTVGKNAIAQGIEFIPFLDVLPIRTTVIVLTILTTNYPERFGALQKVLSAAQQVEGKKKIDPNKAFRRR